MRAGRELLASGVGCGREDSLAKGTATPMQYFSPVCCKFSQGAPSYYMCIAAAAAHTSSQLPAACCTGFLRQRESCARPVPPARLSGFGEDLTVLTSVPRCHVSHSAVVADSSPALDPGRYRKHGGGRDPARDSKRARSVPDTVAIPDAY